MQERGGRNSMLVLANLILASCSEHQPRAPLYRCRSHRRHTLATLHTTHQTPLFITTVVGHQKQTFSTPRRRCHSQSAAQARRHSSSSEYCPPIIPANPADRPRLTVIKPRHGRPGSQIFPPTSPFDLYCPRRRRRDAYCSLAPAATISSRSKPIHHFHARARN